MPVAAKTKKSNELFTAKCPRRRGSLKHLLLLIGFDGLDRHYLADAITFTEMGQTAGSMWVE